MVAVGVTVGVVVALGKAGRVEDLEMDLREGILEVLEGHSTLSHVTSIRYVANSHVTALTKLLSHKLVPVAPLKVVHQDPASEAQETIAEEVDGTFVLGD